VQSSASFCLRLPMVDCTQLNMNVPAHEAAAATRAISQQSAGHSQPKQQQQQEQPRQTTATANSCGSSGPAILLRLQHALKPPPATPETELSLFLYWQPVGQWTTAGNHKVSVVKVLAIMVKA